MNPQMKLSHCKALLVAAVFLCLGVSVSAQLSGAYTIGGSSPDYPTIDSALADLQSQGISAAVTFNIRTGTYTEHLSLSAVAGSDSVNTITFQAESLDSSDVTITYASTNMNDQWTFALYAVEGIAFKHLTFENTGTVAASLIRIDSAAAHITV